MDGRAVGTFSKSLGESCFGKMTPRASVPNLILRKTRMPIQFAPSRGEPRRDAPLGPRLGESMVRPPTIHRPMRGGVMSFRIPPASDADAEACCRDRFLDHLKEKARFGRRSVFPQVQDRRSSEAQPQEPSQPKQSSGRGRDSIVLVKLPERLSMCSEGSGSMSRQARAVALLCSAILVLLGHSRVRAETLTTQPDVDPTAHLDLMQTDFGGATGNTGPTLSLGQFDTQSGTRALQAVDLTFKGTLLDRYNLSFVTPATMSITVGSGNPLTPGRRSRSSTRPRASRSRRRSPTARPPPRRSTPPPTQTSGRGR